MPDAPDWSEEVRLVMKDGRQITMRRNDDRIVQIDTGDGEYLDIGPISAADMLAWVEFFQSLGAVPA